MGDFQTPRDLARRILRRIGPVGKKWKRVLEPTCGKGNFIKELLEGDSKPKEIKGIELQEHYVKKSREIAGNADIPTEIIQGNIFDMDLTQDVQWENEGDLLVVGNPPWVTNSELGALESDNLPEKYNIKKKAGLEAMTGEANFDITEAIWLKIIRELTKEEKVTIALLSKRSVARSVLKYAKKAGLPVSKAKLFKIDAMNSFEAAVDGCLFKVEVGKGRKYKGRKYEARVYKTIESKEPEKKIGMVGDRLISNIEIYKKFEGNGDEEIYTWRQGVKHDASKVMELDYDQKTGVIRNKQGEKVEVEDKFVYPLMKSSDVYHERNNKIRKKVIITQKKLGQKTEHIKKVAPKLWKYLMNHSEALDGRKSRVYEGKPRFSIFGIGDYSFASYKVAISGFYKEINFCFVGELEGKPVMLDDTCYFIPCQSKEEAAVITGALNHPASIEFLESIIFKDSKRPVKKKVLQQLSIKELVKKISEKEIKEIAIERTNRKYELDIKKIEEEIQRQKEKPKEEQLPLL